MKTCNKCNKSKEESEFHAQPRNPGGLHHACILCKREYDRLYKIKNKKSRSEYARKYNKEHKEEQAFRYNRWVSAKKENPGKAIQHKRRASRTLKLSPDESKKRIKQSRRKYAINNSDVFVISRARRKRAVPAWYKTEKESIALLYSKADEWSDKLGITLHVDHIVPIKNDRVCGLHTMANLQLLEAKLNISKNNSFD